MNNKSNIAHLFDAVGMIFINLPQIQKTATTMQECNVEEGVVAGITGPIPTNEGKKVPRIYGLLAPVEFDLDEDDHDVPDIIKKENPEMIFLIKSIGKTTIAALFSDFVVWNENILRFMGDDIIEKIKENNKHHIYPMDAVSLEDIWLIGNHNIRLPEIKSIIKTKDKILSNLGYSSADMEESSDDLEDILNEDYNMDDLFRELGKDNKKESYTFGDLARDLVKNHLDSLDLDTDTDKINNKTRH